MAIPGNSDLQKFFEHKVCHDLGIAPMSTSLRYGAAKALASLPPDEARKMKRKFRKLWRREMKRELRELERRYRRAGLDIEKFAHPVDRWRPLAAEMIKARYGARVRGEAILTRRIASHRRLTIAIRISALALREMTATIGSK